jgi:hypothetical protein
LTNKQLHVCERCDGRVMIDFYIKGSEVRFRMKKRWALNNIITYFVVMRVYSSTVPLIRSVPQEPDKPGSVCFVP